MCLNFIFFEKYQVISCQHKLEHSELKVKVFHYSHPFTEARREYLSNIFQTVSRVLCIANALCWTCFGFAGLRETTGNFWSWSDINVCYWHVDLQKLLLRKAGDVLFGSWREMTDWCYLLHPCICLINFILGNKMFIMQVKIIKQINTDRYKYISI